MENLLQPKEPKKRRGKGEGSIVKRKDGIWQFSFDPGTGTQSERKRIYLYAGTKAALQKKITDERARNNGTFKPPDKQTVGQCVEAYLEMKEREIGKEGAWRPNTYAGHESRWRKHLKPLLGHYRLDKFGVDDVEAFYRAMAAKKSERKNQDMERTAQEAGELMRMVFKDAVRKRKLLFNPWADVDVPGHDSKKAHVLTKEEASRFIEAAGSDRYEALWLLFLNGGLRLGEGLGLQWEKVNLETGEISIEQQLTEVRRKDFETQPKLGPLKTKKSKRLIIVGPITLKAFRRRRDAAQAEGHGSSFCFTSEAGDVLIQKDVREKHFKKVAKAAGIADFHPHDLRHTMASHIDATGKTTAVALAARMGDTVQTALATYAQAFPEQQGEIAVTLEERFSK